MIHLIQWWGFSLCGVILGVLLDFCFGDPAVSWHPICLIGNLISFTRKKLRNSIEKRFPDTSGREEKNKAEFRGGIGLVVIVITVSTLLPSGILVLAYALHPVAGILVEGIFCWFLLATKCLKQESTTVKRALTEEGLESGQRAVARIVGRDTAVLDEPGVIKAAVETVAENSSDGCIAPLFYMLLGGAPLGFFYKSINTMDSMVGYRNETYLYFGCAAAKTDDVANFLPARISALLLVASAGLRGYSASNAWRIFKRDRMKHASPNSAQTESAMAGALGVQLAGDAWYFGELHKKETIGDALREIEPEDIDRANRILYGMVVLGTVLGVLLKGCVLVCMNMAGILPPI